MTSKNENQAYVHVQLNGEYVLAGRIDIHEKKGTFVYGKSYLSRPDAFPLDPINLPLKEKIFECPKTRLNGGVFGVFLDAGPDSWGRKVLMAYYEDSPSTPLGFLLAGNGGGVGALRFTHEPDSKPLMLPHNQVSDLSGLLSAVDSVLGEAEELPQAFREMLLDGSSLGGARPKATIVIDGELYLAKFNRADDEIDQAVIEHATMRMARKAGIVVPETKLLSVEGKNVIMVKRFDRNAQGHCRHYLSVNSLLPMKVNPDDHSVTSPYSYTHLSGLIQSISKEPEVDRKALFRRCAYNVLVGNTDDHAKNHGLMKCEESQYYRLSPAFDIVPQLTNIGIHSLVIGKSGRAGTLDNLVSAAPYHGLTKEQAQDEIRQLQTVVKHWRDLYRECGVSETDIKRVSQSFLFDRKYLSAKPAGGGYTL